MSQTPDAVETPDRAPLPPVTGHPDVDAALAALDLSGPVDDHAAALAAAHEALQRVLNPREPAEP